MPVQKHGVTYYSVSELAKKLQVHRNSIIYWIANDKIKAVRLGLATKSPYRIPESEVNRVSDELADIMEVA